MSTAISPWNQFQTSIAALSATEQATALSEYGGKAQREPIIILGAGLAGCWLARRLAERGIAVRVIEANESVASAASGNPAGIVKPYVTRSPCPAMDFHVQAHAYLLGQLRSLPELGRVDSGPAQLKSCGVLQLVHNAYPPSAHYHAVNEDQSAQLAGLPLNSPALHFEGSGWLDPSSLCQFLMAHPAISLECGTRVQGITQKGHALGQPLWQINLESGQQRWSTRLVLACGASIANFEQTLTLPVVAARGQISRFALRAGSVAPRCVINGKHYLIPDGESIIVGATFERDNHHVAVTDEDHARNMAGLRAMAPTLQVHGQALSGKAGIRATTPDRLPIAGPAPDWARVNDAYADLRHGKPAEHYPALPCHAGLYLLGGLGSRGIVTAPLLAQWLADRLMSEDNRSSEYTTGNDWTHLLNPARFQLRDLKRGTQRASHTQSPSVQ